MAHRPNPAQCLLLYNPQAKNKNFIYIYIFFFYFFLIITEDNFSLLLERKDRGGGTGREPLMWERNINLLPSCMLPNRGWKPSQPGHMPWPGIKPMTLRGTMLQSTEPHQPGQNFYFFKLKKKILFTFIFRENAREGDREGETHPRERETSMSCLS